MIIPIYATADIAKGDGGYWPYEDGKGVGGADSYTFDDSGFEVEQTFFDPSRAAHADAGGM
jgi:hypothetical protein